MPRRGRDGRVSSTRTTAPGDAASSWRTTSSPVRAVERQCTRRGSSPGLVLPKREELAAAARRRAPAPRPRARRARHRRPRGRRAATCTAGRRRRPSARRRPTTSGQAERVGDGRVERPDDVPAAPRGRDPVGGRSAAARGRGRDEKRPLAVRRRRVGERQQRCRGLVATGERRPVLRRRRGAAPAARPGSASRPRMTGHDPGDAERARAAPPRCRARRAVRRRGPGSPTTRPAAAPASVQPRRVSARGPRPVGPRPWSAGGAGDRDRARGRRATTSRGGDAAQLGLGSEHQPVLEDRRRQHLDVVGDHVVAAGSRRRARARRAAARARPGAHAEREVGVAARRVDDVDDVRLERRRRRGRVATASAAAATSAAVGDRLELVGRDVAAPWASRIATSASRSGSPSATRMRKRSSCASGSGYVPSSSTGFCVAITRNGRGSAVGVRVDRDLPLFHRLEQRRLRLRRRPVDLVGEHDVGEHAAGPELEIARAPGSRPTTPVTSDGRRSGVNWMRCARRRRSSARSPWRATSCRRRGRPR